MMLPACVYVRDCVTVITTAHSSVNAGFVRQIVRYIHIQASLTSPPWEDVLQWDNTTFKQENGLLSLQN